MQGIDERRCVFCSLLVWNGTAVTYQGRDAHQTCISKFESTIRGRLEEVFPPKNRELSEVEKEQFLEEFAQDWWDWTDAHAYNFSWAERAAYHSLDEVSEMVEKIWNSY